MNARLCLRGPERRLPSARFCGGIQSACQALGLTLPNQMRWQATEERGWPRSAEVWSVSAMRERGLTDEAIADEMIAIDIEAWRRLAETDKA